MIYGIGTTYGGTDEKFPEFVATGSACVGWPKEESPGLHQIFARMTVGDIVFAKSFPPRQGLYIKGVGIVTSPDLFNIPSLGVARAVHWVWHTDDTRDYVSLGRLDDRYDYFRGGTLYEELGPKVQSKVLQILIEGKP